MNRLYRTSAALLVTALLAGCGAKTMAPAGATSVAAMSLQAKAVVAVDPQVQTLITQYKAISGYDADAMKKRDDIVAQLGDSDSDLAASFLETEYANLSAFPEDVRPDFETKISDALLALDTYESDLDDPAIAAGAGTTLVQMEAYFDASLRKKRHSGFLHWVTSPFRWVGNGLKNFWNGLTGHKPRKRHRRPSPGGGTGGGFPSTPSYPSTPSDPNSPF